MTVGGLSLKVACFEVGRALEVAKGIDDPISLAFSKLSGLRTGVFFFLLDLVIFQVFKSGDTIDEHQPSLHIYGCPSCERPVNNLMSIYKYVKVVILISAADFPTYQGLGHKNPSLPICYTAFLALLLPLPTQTLLGSLLGSLCILLPLFLSRLRKIQFVCQRRSLIGIHPFQDVKYVKFQTCVHVNDAGH